MALIHDAQPGDVIRIGANTVIKFERKSGGRTRVRIESDYPIKVARADEAKPGANIVKRPPLLHRE